MRRKHFLIVAVFLLVATFQHVSVLAACFETSSGSLTIGSLTAALPALIATYMENVPEGSVYGIQEGNKYYGKVCDEPEQVQHFMETKVYPRYPNGEWTYIKSATNAESINVTEDGIYKFSHSGAKLNVYKYK